jgi:hypothetical protein
MSKRTNERKKREIPAATFFVPAVKNHDRFWSYVACCRGQLFAGFFGIANGLARAAGASNH